MAFAAAKVYAGSGDGTGDCRDQSQTGFNGAAENRITCAYQWYANMIRW
jgi:hypothetical protein